jgi:hypothetical protein
MTPWTSFPREYRELCTRESGPRMRNVPPKTSLGNTESRRSDELVSLRHESKREPNNGTVVSISSEAKRLISVVSVLPVKHRNS